MWKLTTDSPVATLLATRELDKLGLALPVRCDGRDMIFDSARNGSARNGREIDEVIQALWDGPGEIVAAVAAD